MNNLQKQIIERYAEKKINSQDFKYKNYIALRRQIIDKNMKLTNKRLKEMTSRENWERKPESRFIDSNSFDNIFCASEMGGLTTGVLITQYLNNNPGAIFMGGIAGLAVGGIAGLINVKAYQDMPLGKLVKKAVIKHKNRNVKKLGNKIKINNFKLYCLNQHANSLEISMEDFERSLAEEHENYSNSL